MQSVKSCPDHFVMNLAGYIIVR